MEIEKSMILTHKIKHGCDFSEEFKKARQVAEYGLKTKSRSSSDVKQFGLKSTIANQILRKYSGDKECKRIRSVLLSIPSQSINVDMEKRVIKIPCLKLELNYMFRNDFVKVNKVEINRDYAFVSITVEDEIEIVPVGFIGVDLNTTGHCVVVGNPITGKVVKMGKQAHHIHNKYKSMRRSLQKKGKYGMVKRIKDREKRLVRDLNHKMSREIVEIAKENKCGIRLENLKGIRKRGNQSKSFRYSLNSWSYYQLQEMVEYKAKLLGIPVQYIAPQYTSQLCSRCGLIGTRNGKEFKCSNCGHVDHADCNASFNIAKRSPDWKGIGQSSIDRDMLEGNTDIPREATQ